MRFILDLSHFILNFILTYDVPGIFCIASPCDLTRNSYFLCQPIRIETNVVPRANCHLHERTYRSLIGKSKKAITCSLTSELTVQMLKYIVRGHVCCPLIHHSLSLSVPLSLSLSVHYTMLSCPFLCRSRTTTLSLLENGNGEAINSTTSL